MKTAASKLTKKYQATIPGPVRKILHLGAGDVIVFDIEDDGSLTHRRVWAEMGMRAPDGICLDEWGNVWVANAVAAECVLVAQGGEIMQIVETSQPCFACMLGGDDGRTLHMVTARSSDKRAASAEATGKIEVFKVDVASAGCP